MGPGVSSGRISLPPLAVHALDPHDVALLAIQPQFGRTKQPVDDVAVVDRKAKIVARAKELLTEGEKEAGLFHFGECNPTLFPSVSRNNAK